MAYTEVDILAIGAHPDDVELGCGGTLIKLSRQGKRIAILDLTQGEMGSRGTPEERAHEAYEAARIMGVVSRENAGLPDGALTNILEQKQAIIPFIRKFRPKVLLLLSDIDRHPDHVAAHALVKDANYLAGLHQLYTGLEPYRCLSLFYYNPYLDFGGTPCFVVDISDTFESKLDALRAHRSQFFNPGYEGTPTFISTKEFWDGIEIRAKYWGQRAGVRFGEPFYADLPIKVNNFPVLE